MSEWNIIFYTTPNGYSPVTDFIDNLDEKAQAKVVNTVRLLREYGVRLGGSHTKKLKGTDMWELRILGGDSIRIFYIAVEQKNFLFLHGFKKKSYKTPAKELKQASERLRDYRTRK
jgi:phage-related protein